MAEFDDTIDEFSALPILSGNKKKVYPKRDRKNYQITWYKTNRAKKLKQSHLIYLKNKKNIINRTKTYFHANKDKVHGWRKKYYEQYKIPAFEAYGGFECLWCGEIDKNVLELDHIKNDGAQHRKEIGSGSTYKWLKKHNYPAGILQVLCANCNLAKRINGGILPENRYNLHRNNKSEIKIYSLSEMAARMEEAA